MKNMIKFVNLTPHDLTIQAPDPISGIDVPKIIPKSGQIARVSVQQTERKLLRTTFGLLQVVANEFGEVEGIPEPKEHTIFLVSSIVLSQTTRKDVMAPDTGATAIRNEKGQIIAVTRLVSN